MRVRSSFAHRWSIAGPHAAGMALRDMAQTPTARPNTPDRKLFGNLPLFLSGQAFSHSGTWLQFVALAWLAGELTGSGTGLGWITAAAFGPLLALGPWTGAPPTVLTNTASSWPRSS